MNINEEVCSCEGPHALCHPEALGLQTGGERHGSPELRACGWDWAVMQAAVGPSVFKSMFSSLLPPAQTHELSLLACVFSPHTVQE